MDTSLPMQTANNLVRKGDLNEAIQIYKTLIKQNPNFSWSYYCLGNAFKRKGELQEAISFYKMAIQVNPDIGCFYYDLAKILQQQGKLNEAIDEIRKAICLNPERTKYYTFLAFIYEINSDFERAFIYWQKVLATNPNHLNAPKKVNWLKTDIAQDYFDQGHKFYHEGKLEEAFRYYKTTLIINSNQFKTWETFKELCDSLLYPLSDKSYLGKIQSSSQLFISHEQPTRDLDLNSYIQLIHRAYQCLINCFLEGSSIHLESRKQKINYFINFVHAIIKELPIPNTSYKIKSFYEMISHLHYEKQDFYTSTLYKSFIINSSTLKEKTGYKQLIEAAEKVNKNQEVIILYLSHPYYNLFLIWYKYFQQHKLSNLIIIALDPLVYDLLKDFGIKNEHLVLFNIYRMQSKFGLCLFRYRIEITSSLVLLVYHVVTTGVDAVWLGNVLEHKIVKNFSPDILGGIAPGTTPKIRAKWNKGFVINGDFWFIKSNPRTKRLCQKMLELYNNSPTFHDQELLAYGINAIYPKLEWQERPNYYIFQSDITILVLNQEIISRIRGHSRNSYILHPAFSKNPQKRAKKLQDQLHSLGLEN